MENIPEIKFYHTTVNKPILYNSCRKMHNFSWQNVGTLRFWKLIALSFSLMNIFSSNIMIHVYLERATMHGSVELFCARHVATLGMFLQLAQSYIANYFLKKCVLILQICS